MTLRTPHTALLDTTSLVALHESAPNILSTKLIAFPSPASYPSLLIAPKSGIPSIIVPASYPTAMIYVDESGARASASRYFVVAAIKVRQHGSLFRAVRAVRDRHDFRGEMKFSAVTRGALAFYYDLIDQLEASDLHVAACVVDTSVMNPFGKGREVWQVQMDVITQLLVGCINRRELVSVLLDGVSTPTDVPLEDVIRARVNKRLGNASVITAACVDSKSSDGIQLADLVAGSIASERRRLANESGSPNSNKSKVAARLRTALGVDTFNDDRTRRTNIATFRAPQRSTPRQLTLPVTTRGG